ncbi:MAG: methyltransferase domain-containing protein [Methanomethylovorans sp.]|jgi:ubiquinone/menaquinone biosynthesis C-methylase UbiE|nr:methyltransferase domain-containing protein [Methanomethylovorans sp.]
MDQLSIGKVYNYASEENMKILPLWKQSISAIEIMGVKEELFSEEYSHYIVIHDALNIRFPESRDELNRRFCAQLGASVVRYIRKQGNVHYVRGLMAENGASIYSILPYTSFDLIENAKFPKNSMEERKIKAFEEIIPLLNGEKILDVGCGLGTLTIKIAAMKPDISVYGVDLQESLMKQCRFNAEIEGVGNIKFVAGSAYELPFEDAYFDVITCFFMLHHLDDVPKALKEIKRVLKPTGEVFVVEPIDHFHDIQRNPDDWKKLFIDAGYAVDVRKKHKLSYIKGFL